MAKRYQELDSLRGLAAITVMVYHTVSITTLFFSGPTLFMYSPLQVLVAGHQAVIMFFVLSGFVLSLPYLNKTEPTYSSFIVRRVFRIYVPYIIAVTFGCVMRLTLVKGGVPQHWITLWNVPISAKSILDHIILIGSFNQDTFDPVVWSLVYEMRISLLFPFLMVLVKYSSKSSLLIAGLTWSIGMALHYFFLNVDVFTNFIDTFQYIFVFTLGALLAKHIQWFMITFRALGSLKKIVTIVTGFLLYTYSTSIYHPWEIVASKLFGSFSSERFLSFLSTYGGNYGANLLATIGAAIGIVFVLSSSRAGRVLKSPILQFLGKISYSLYLYHLIIVLSLTLVFTRLHASTWILWASIFAVSIGISGLAYVAIELPAIRLGKQLTRNMERTGTVSKGKTGTERALEL